MMLSEANDRLKKGKINEEQLWGLNSLYLLLDLHKDEFCKIVDLVGVETLLNKQKHYDRLLQAEEELNAKEKFLQAKRRLEEMETEKARLEEIVAKYKPY
jgi:predicted nuclease with TOPRIM domain